MNTDGNLAALASHLAERDRPRPGDACDCGGHLELIEADEDFPRARLVCDECGEEA